MGFLKKLLDITNAELISVKDDQERFMRGTNEENVYKSTLLFWLSSKVSIALRKYTQTFEPIDITNAIDYIDQPLNKYDINLFLLHGHTSNDLCIQYKDIVFCGDICMSS
ncbi:MAG: hypothetical protein K5765_09135 [Clostridia bacterium]|nr:hypothetical protein [Clostridia bacterium]